MKTAISQRLYGAGLMVTLIGLTWACEKDNVEKLSADQIRVRSSAVAEANTAIIATTMDVLDASGSGLENQGVTDGRIDGITSKHGNNECSPAISGSFKFDKTRDSTVYSGTLVLDYGIGASCSDSTELRKGKITDSYRFVVFTGKDSISYALYENFEFQGYQKDSIIVDGTFSSLAKPGVTKIQLSGVRFVYADGTSSTINASLSSERSRDGHLLRENTKTISGSLNGKTRDGIEFSSGIISNIVFDYTCSRRYPVSGVVDMTFGGVKAKVDYGAGSCDTTYTITVDGTVDSHMFANNN